jgi:putative methionine-R-sulfoxide reductase with GAF domain
VWLATHAVDIGAITPFFYTFRERDAILDLFEEYCGARLTLNCMTIGGVPFDVTDDWLRRVGEFVDAFPGHIACASSTRSELVIPVRDASGAVIAVLDIDSDQPDAFTQTDADKLQAILKATFSPQPVSAET